MPDYGLGKHGAKMRGPYGENEGDIYLAADWIQKMLARDEPGSVGIIEIMRDEHGKLQEHFYHTKIKSLIERAKAGNKLFLAGSLQALPDDKETT